MYQSRETKLVDAFFVTHSFRVDDFTAGHCRDIAACNAHIRTPPRDGDRVAMWREDARRDGIRKDEGGHIDNRGELQTGAPPSIRLYSRPSLGVYRARPQKAAVIFRLRLRPAEPPGNIEIITWHP